MAYVPVPKDLTKVKIKVMFNLTKRQLICFSIAAAVGIPLFFLLKSYTSVSAATLMMVLSMLPFFLLAMYERNGQPLEVIFKNIIRVRFVRSKQRPYRTDNFYAAVNRQIKLDKEVKAIVYKTDCK
ncbi:MAG: PrgI family protein, partial [Kiritimatiellia bacterium]